MRRIPCCICGRASDFGFRNPKSQPNKAYFCAACFLVAHPEEKDIMAMARKVANNAIGKLDQ